MWGRLVLVAAVVASTLAAPAPCPVNCECTIKPSGHLALKCNSTGFIAKVQPKQVHSIVELELRSSNPKHLRHLKELYRLEKLDLSNNGLTTLRNFPHLPKLKTLKLSRNHLKEITANTLPKSLENIDLSFNAFTVIPEELIYLTNLKKVNVYRNPLVCMCDTPNFSLFHKLVAQGTTFTKPVECESPHDFKGKFLSSLKCKINDLDIMQGDDSLSGIWSNDVLDDEPKHEEDGIEQGFIVANQKKLESASQVLDEAEGSGDDDLSNVNRDSTTLSPEEDDFTHGDSFMTDNDYEYSGDGEESTTEPDLIIPPICRFNCTTRDFKESGEENEIKGNKTLGIVEMTKILMEDLSGKTTTSTAVPPPVSDIVPQRNRNVLLHMPKENVTSKEVEIIKPETDKTDDLERQLTQPSDTASTAYIVVAAIVILIAGLALYVMLKKKQKKRNRRNGPDPEKAKPVEMKELLKKPIPEVHQPIEKSPLINGQNGTKVDAPPMNGTKDHTGIPEPLDIPHIDSETSPNDEDEQLRPKEDENLLTPETKRVIVQASELTAPKTPILVNRSVSSDGKVVSTSAETP